MFLSDKPRRDFYLLNKLIRQKYLKIFLPLLFYSCVIFLTILLPPTKELHKIKNIYVDNQIEMNKMLEINKADAGKNKSSQNGGIEIFLPATQETDDFLKLAGDYAYSCGLDVRKTDVRKTEKSGNYEVMPVSFSGSGSFQNIRRFIYLLENSEEELVVVNDVKIEWYGPVLQYDCDYTLSCSVYSQSNRIK